MFFTRIARERLWLSEEVSSWNDRTWHRNIVDDGEKIIERAERRQPAVDGEGRESLREAVLNILIYLMKTYGRGRFPCIEKEERQVAHVVLRDARVRVLAFQPNFKLGEFEVHGSLLFEEESTSAKKAVSMRTSFFVVLSCSFYNLLFLIHGLITFIPMIW